MKKKHSWLLDQFYRTHSTRDNENTIKISLIFSSFVKKETRLRLFILFSDNEKCVRKFEQLLLGWMCLHCVDYFLLMCKFCASITSALRNHDRFVQYSSTWQVLDLSYWRKTHRYKWNCSAARKFSVAQTGFQRQFLHNAQLKIPYA